MGCGGTTPSSTAFRCRAGEPLTWEGGGLTPPSAIPTVEPRWEEPGEAPSEVVQSLKEALSLPEVLCALLVQRDLADPDRAKAFLRPLLSELDPPDSLAGIAPAAKRVLDAVRRGRNDSRSRRLRRGWSSGCHPPDEVDSPDRRERGPLRAAPFTGTAMISGPPGSARRGKPERT